mmetsp:Transcript_16038/g.29082  ORF Transcript_16038/g.29082 Transcript_16038/m.29082 type:complete len:124 (+) Transcript_16038:134-505(+)|eukprot:CAMPEP_0201910718 /NCGR_PEP_ID=MMETSP0903-20130614/1987_1 /ASSEMBLY_ACC=CAM_ASM_000552 /TAXON_ID=420261 /ORGANISM="Thalassiosira antarctica, Strain CCMP982" /LENGTH=123 /DNA_ID=CAMNT_0048445389 /DNA_START=92 /DNA_END=463 /DNA_ORIENTATION=+
MNCSRPILRRVLLLQPPLHTQTQQSPKLFFSTTPTPFALTAGTPIPGLESIYPKVKDPSQSKVPTAKPREEYPSWVSDLVKPPATLAKLRNMKIENATDKDMKRYLKLVRRAKIKQNNVERAK